MPDADDMYDALILVFLAMGDSESELPLLVFSLLRACLRREFLIACFW